MSNSQKRAWAVFGTLRRSHMAFVLTTLVACIASGRAKSQCLNWDSSFGAQYIQGEVRSLHVHDDGSGPGLYAGGVMSYAAGIPISNIAKWNGTAWEALGPPIVPGGGSGVEHEVYAMATFSHGGQTCLYAGGFAWDLMNQPTSRISRWNGSSWSLPGAVQGAAIWGLAVHDDGTGQALFMGGDFNWAGPVFSPHIAKFNGTSWSSVGGGMNGPIYSMAVWDDGSGAKLYVSGNFTVAGTTPATRVAVWDGSTWSSLGGAPPATYFKSLVVFDDGSGPALYGNRGPVSRWNSSAWEPVGTGLGGAPFGLGVFDDGTGSALYACGSGAVLKLAGDEWQNLGWGPSGDVHAIASFDGGAVGPALYAGGSFSFAGANPSFGLAAWRGCDDPIETVCAGDGTMRDCPCSNRGSVGRGCAWSGSASGASLITMGTIDPDSLVLQASGMPLTSSAIFVKSDDFALRPALYGDGLLCLQGTLIRLATKVCVQGAAQFPEAGNASLSQRGQTPPGSGLIGYYQAVYRNAAAFCTPSTFNATNGVRVVW